MGRFDGAADDALALLANLPALYESDLRAVLDPADASELSAFEALRACAAGVDSAGARRPVSCAMTYALSGSGVFTKRLVNVLLHGRVAWRTFDVAHGITGDACAALAGVGLVLCAHPLHAECVSWTGARPLLLATCLALEAVKRCIAGDARLGAAFTFMACAAHAAEAAQTEALLLLCQLPMRTLPRTHESETASSRPRAAAVIGRHAREQSSFEFALSLQGDGSWRWTFSTVVCQFSLGRVRRPGSTRCVGPGTVGKTRTRTQQS